MASGFKKSTTDLDSFFLPRSYTNLPTTLVEGQLWAWGRGLSGALGDGTIASKSSPVQVGSLTTWKSVSVSDHVGAVDSTGALWSWGTNTAGQLGLGDTTARSSPVQVGALTDWKQVSTSISGFTVAVKTDGTLWAWGTNTAGLAYLGLGDTTPRSSPVQVGALTDWKQVSTGGSFSVAVKTDGTLWAWGGLGTGTTSSPVQIGAASNWNLVSVQNSSAMMITTEGTLWGWGTNTGGELGTGDLTNRHSSPVQIGALTDWKEVSVGSGHTLAVKTDGTLWAWGAGDDGQLGIGLASVGLIRSSPVQVGSLTTWKSVAAAGAFSIAVKTDGTLWAWGDNTYGQLGTNTRTSYSSPIQIGSLATWKQAAGYLSVVATKLAV